MLQREEVAPTGESWSIIHVVYLISICLVELLLQVFVQPHTLVLQILRMLLVWKNQSESVANVHRELLCCVRYYRDELWMDMSVGLAGIRRAASKAGVTKVFHAAKQNASSGAVSIAMCHSIFFTEESVALAVHTTLGLLTSGLLLICVSYSIFSSTFLVCIFPELHPASPWYLGTCCIKMS